MRVVAKQGNKCFMVALSDDPEVVNRDPRALGRVLDLDEKEFYPPARMQSHFGRGYWEPFSASDEQLQTWLAQVKDLDPDATRAAASPLAAASA